MTGPTRIGRTRTGHHSHAIIGYGTEALCGTDVARNTLESAELEDATCGHCVQVVDAKRRREGDVGKVCSRCEQDKPRGQFYRQASSPDGLQGWCKDCHRSWQSVNANHDRDRQALHVDTDLYAAVKAAASARGVTVKDWASRALTKALREQADQMRRNAIRNVGRAS